MFECINNTIILLIKHYTSIKNTKTEFIQCCEITQCRHFNHSLRSDGTFTFTTDTFTRASCT